MTDSLNQDPDTDEDQEVDLGDLLLEVLPGDGSTIGNMSAREALSRATERQVGEEEYEALKEHLFAAQTFKSNLLAWQSKCYKL